MSCFHPLHAFPYDSASSKFGQYRIYSHKTHLDPVVDRLTGELLQEIDIPCGKCVGCRLDYSKQWATRMVLESMGNDHNYFLTLTYNDDFCPTTKDGKKVLDPSDLQLWLKRLRRSFSYDLNHDGIRFYACGEYGSLTLRPHYHVCIFNAPFDDLKQIGFNKLGDPLYESQRLIDSWSKEVTRDQRLPLGHVCLGKMSWRTCAYTARYTMKKAGGQDASYYEKLGLVPEFVRMSRRPGIGLDYFLSHSDVIYDSDQIVLPALSKDKPNVQRIPRYFDKKMAEIDPIRVSLAKERRFLAGQLARDAKLSQVGLEEEEYFELEERLCSDRLKNLIREL